MKSRFLIPVLASIFGAGALAEAQSGGRCDLQNVFWMPGNDVHTKLIVGSNVACRRSINSNLPIEFIRAEVTQRARNGIAGAANAFTFAYKSSPGFTGTDQFQVTFHMRQSGTTTVLRTRYNVAVEVVR